MELTEQERELEKSTAEAHIGFSLGLLATALFVDSVSDGLWWLPLVILGALFALSSIKLALLHRWKRKEFLAIATKIQLKHVTWFLGFVALGIGLIQRGLVIQGLIFVFSAYFILSVGVGQNTRLVAKAMKMRLRKG